jgi:peptidoglycan/LPS O-acetylase OafA/YrhL
MTLLIEKMRTNEINSIFEKLLIWEFANYAKIIYAVLGLFSIYLIANYLIENKKIVISNLLLTLASYSLGIYLFQQFILQILYYKTDLPIWIGYVWLLWIGFAVTMFLSIILTKYALKTKFGRFLIG